MDPVVRPAGRAARPGTIGALESNAIGNALKQCGGNVVKAAKVLGMSPATHYRRLNTRKPADA